MKEEVSEMVEYNTLIAETIKVNLEELGIYVREQGLISKLQEKFLVLGLDEQDLQKQIDLTSSLLGCNEKVEGWVSFAKIVTVLVLSAEFNFLTRDVSKYAEGNRLFCDELGYVLDGAVSLVRNEIIEDALEVVTGYSLLSMLASDVTVDDYFANNHYAEDIALLHKIFIAPPADSDGEYNKKVLKDIVDNSPSFGLAKDLISKIDDIMNCLAELYSPTFLLHPYVGVLSLFGAVDGGISRDGIVKSSDDDKYKPSKDEAFSFYEALARTITEYSGYSATKVSNSRFFDIEDILESRSIKYYPYEAFALATKAELGKPYKPKESDIVYNKTSCTTWDDYSVSVREYLTDLLSKYIYKSVEKNCLTNKNEKFTFLDDSFLLDYEADKLLAYHSRADVNKYGSFVIADVDKFVKTVCSAIIITRNDFNEVFKVKISDFDGKLNKSMTSVLFDSAVFMKGAKDVKTTDAYAKDMPAVGCTVFEFSFCRDARLFDKMPLFGYTAARLFAQNRTQISSSNILIGETEDDMPLFSTQGGVVDTVSKYVHRINAGSRAGKGVMTMNILASSIADDTAVFYIDKKPDMASEFARISQGNMFVVNGGQLAPSEDVRKQFVDNGAMLSWYKAGSASYKTRPMTSAFGNDFGSSYVGAFGDMIYARAMILALSIVGARIKLMTSSQRTPDAESDLFLNGRIAVVVDEITNWHNEFEHAYFETYAKGAGIGRSVLKQYYNPVLGLKTLTGGDDIDSMLANVDETNKELLMGYKARKEECLQAYNENRNDSKAIKDLEQVNNQIDRVLRKLNRGKKPTNIEEMLYWSTYFDKYRSIVQAVSTIQNAAENQTIRESTDVYLIGQSISGVPNTGEPITFNKDGSVREMGKGLPEAEETTVLGKDSLTRSYLLGFADVLGCDWFIGRNLSDKTKEMSDPIANFGGSAISDDLRSWLHIRGNWGYVQGGAQKLFRGGSPANMPANIVKFKPYLVLNSNDEPTERYNSTRPYDGTPEKYVVNCAERVGFENWENLRLHHVKRSYKASRSNPCYGHLEDGIGLKGLIEEYKRTNPAFQNYDFDQDCLSKSKQIADAVCRKFGYSGYIEYLHDFTPKGLIGADDIVNMYSDMTFRENKEKRLVSQLSRYANTSNMDLVDPSIHIEQPDEFDGDGSDFENEVDFGMRRSDSTNSDSSNQNTGWSHLDTDEASETTEPDDFDIFDGVFDEPEDVEEVYSDEVLSQIIDSILKTAGFSEAKTYIWNSVHAEVFKFLRSRGW